MDRSDCLVSSHSEASKLLEAALEQMDGIIQGARFELPHYNESTKSSYSANNFESSHNSQSIATALSALKQAIVNSENKGSKFLAKDLDQEMIGFLSRWLSNNQASSLEKPAKFSARDDDDNQLLLQDENRALQVQVNALNNQLARQRHQMAEMEQLLDEKDDLLKMKDEELEVMSRLHQQHQESNINAKNLSGLQSELNRFKNRCAELAKENEELRKICSGNRSPRYIPLSPENHHHQEQRSDGTGREREKQSPDTQKAFALETSPAFGGMNRSGRSFRRIFGRIRRSNSGGQLEDSLRRSATPDFQRGGIRATTSGRVGEWKAVQFKPSKPFSEWNVDIICDWLESLGLGMYIPEVRRTTGTVEELTSMSFLDLETKLHVRNHLHRKKLYLALLAKHHHSQESSFRDPEGDLDFQWVLRWLDDIGLPQYKDTFLEARVDGRVLNVLTTEELFQLKVTNLLHHLSIRRGIQVLRERNFDPECLKRRAIPGEAVDPEHVALWTNHRVMEWLKQVDLAEYAPNLRGSGVHGALIIHEHRFNDNLMAELLSIPANKTLLRRHLSIHFKELVGRVMMQQKRAAEQDTNALPLTPTAKAKCKQSSGQFTLKRKKSKLHLDFGELVCPMPKQSVASSKS